MNRRVLRQQRAGDRLAAASGVVLGRHAEARRVELGYLLAEVHGCVARPEQTYCCPASYGPDRRMYQRGDIAVVVDERMRTIVTVLRRTHIRWEHGSTTRASSRRAPDRLAGARSGGDSSAGPGCGPSSPGSAALTVRSRPGRGVGAVMQLGDALPRHPEQLAHLGQPDEPSNRF